MLILIFVVEADEGADRNAVIQSPRLLDRGVESDDYQCHQSVATQNRNFARPEAEAEIRCSENLPIRRHLIENADSVNPHGYVSALSQRWRSQARLANGHSAAGPIPFGDYLIDSLVGTNSWLRPSVPQNASSAKFRSFALPIASVESMLRLNFTNTDFGVFQKRLPRPTAGNSGVYMISRITKHGGQNTEDALADFSYTAGSQLMIPRAQIIVPSESREKKTALNSADVQALQQSYSALLVRHGLDWT